jgi:hypothetical protein
MFFHVVAFTAPVLIVFLNSGNSLLNSFIATFSILVYITIAKWKKWQIPLFKVQKNATIAARLKEVQSIDFKTLTIKKLPFIFKTYAFYFASAILPIKLGLFPTFGYGYAICKESTKELQKLDKYFYLSLFVIILNIILITTFWGTRIAYGLIWWNVLMLPFCNWVILQQTIADRYVYVPCAGLMYAIASVFDYLPNPEMIAAFYFGILCTKNWLWLPSYADMETHIKYNIHDWPDSFAAWNWMGVLHNVKGMLFASIYHWAIGLRYAPTEFRLNYNISHALKVIGLANMAKVFFDQAGEGIPEDILKANEAELKKQEEDFTRRMNMQRKGERLHVVQKQNKV